ncbi:MAG: GntR family transcriptional regulator [Anaerolineales bacterium]|nr:GntR family transcriptional regulator [Anaerolineales bacterium]
MTVSMESVLIALSRLPSSDNLKLRRLASEANVSMMSCRRAVRRLSNEGYITAFRAASRGNLTYSFSLTGKGQDVAVALKYQQGL